MLLWLVGRRRGHDGPVTATPPWWRDQRPSGRPRGHPDRSSLITGAVTSADSLPTPTDAGVSLQASYFFRAAVRNIELALNDTHLSVEWSEFDGCHFRQRARPLLNAQGVAAQGSFGNSPAVYRECTFERVRFKQLGGFSMGQARFEKCTFVNCRWEGNFAHRADLIDNTFVGRMNGCVWFGQSSAGRRNLIHGNDFSAATIGENVAWRGDFPLKEQRWPADYTPLVDD